MTPLPNNHQIQNSLPPASPLSAQQLSFSPFHANLHNLTPENPLPFFEGGKELFKDEIKRERIFEEDGEGLKLLESYMQDLDGSVFEHPTFKAFPGVQKACHDLLGKYVPFDFTRYALLWCEDSPSEIFPISISVEQLNEYQELYPGYINPRTLSSRHEVVKEMEGLSLFNLVKSPELFQKGHSFHLATSLKDCFSISSGRNVALCRFCYQGKVYTALSATEGRGGHHSEMKVLGAIPPDLLRRYSFNQVSGTSQNTEFIDNEDSQDSFDSLSRQSSLPPSSFSSTCFETEENKENLQAGMKEKGNKKKRKSFSPAIPHKRKRQEALADYFSSHFSSTLPAVDLGLPSDSIRFLFTERAPCRTGSNGHSNCTDKLKVLLGHPPEGLAPVDIRYCCDYSTVSDEREKENNSYKNLQSQFIQAPNGGHLTAVRTELVYCQLIGHQFEKPEKPNARQRKTSNALETASQKLTKHCNLYS